MYNWLYLCFRNVYSTVLYLVCIMLGWRATKSVQMKNIDLHSRSQRLKNNWPFSRSKGITDKESQNHKIVINKLSIPYDLGQYSKSQGIMYQKQVIVIQSHKRWRTKFQENSDRKKPSIWLHLLNPGSKNAKCIQYCLAF